MCGIAGILNSTGIGEKLDAVLRRMQQALNHRGPDDQGWFVSENRSCGLAHTRLSIIDLSPSGHQPMRDRITGNWIVFNGEIYNYRELRQQLEPEVRGQRSEVGQRFDGRGTFDVAQDRLRSETGNGSQRSEIRDQKSDANQFEIRNPKSEIWNSNSDTEVILRAYAKWGRDCVQHLRGMFAFAIWDQEKQELFLARDPLGIKPLYYYERNDTFLFASEVRALLATDLIAHELSINGLLAYLQFGSVQDPLTMVEAVQSLLPGHCLTVKRWNQSIRCQEFEYFTLNESRKSDNLNTSQSPVTRTEAVAEVRKILENSMQAHLISDVPVAAFLSGGIDSSAVVALMSRVADQKVKTFNVAFAESEFSEDAHAKFVAKLFDTEHHEILLSEESLLDLLCSAMEAMDQPTMDGINTFVISKAVKAAGVQVALSGLGGDELFGGYPSFHRAQQMRRVTSVPFPLRQWAATKGRHMLNGSARKGKLWDLVSSDCSPHAAYALSRQLFSPTEISDLVLDPRSDPALTKVQGIPDLGTFAGDGSHAAADGDVINTVSKMELSGYMVNTLLRDTDQMSMAHALEVRVPFIDPIVVRYILGLAGTWKIDSGRPKPLLVDALADVLPKEVTRRPKMGFTLPFRRWLKSALQTDVNSSLSGETDLSHIGISSETARKIWQAFKTHPAQEPWSRPWSLYVLKKWCDLNDVHL